MLYYDKINETYKKIRKDDSLVRLFVLTFLGIGLHVIFVISIIGLPQPSSTTLETPQIIFIALYFGLAIAYSIVATLSFSPKRIVSPIYIQISTAVVVTIIMAFVLYVSQVQSISQMPSDQQIIGTIAMVLLLLGLLGFVQTEIVRRIVGLNGTEDDLDKATFRINMNFWNILKIMTEKSFRNLGDFHITKEETMLVLESRLRQFNEKIIFVLTEDRQDANYSILATIAYESKYYYISKSSDAVERLDSILLDLDKNLKKVKDDIVRTSITFDNDASRKARKLALKETEPKIFAVKYVPRHILLAIIATVALIGIMTYGRFYANFVSEDLYNSSLVFIVIAILFEFIPLVREARTKKVNE